MRSRSDQLYQTDMKTVHLLCTQNNWLKAYPGNGLNVTNETGILNLANEALVQDHGPMTLL